MALTDKAILKIKEMIQQGVLKPGDRLPPEKELSEELGLSRSSMREAIKALEVIRVLDVRRGDGTYVTSLEPRLLLEAVTFVVDMQADESLLELLAVRRMIEPAAAALAAQRMDAEKVAELRITIAAVNGSQDIEELVRHDIEFHAAIVDAAGNSYLSTLVGSLSSHTIRARVWRGLTQDNAVERTLSEHEAITAALERGDAKLSEALMFAHVAGVEQWLRDWNAALPGAGEPDQIR